jgi:hypothetical protein
MIATSSLVATSASVEIGAGLALLSWPKTAVRLLLGVEPRRSGLVASRAVGLGLLSLGLACLPRRRARHRPASGRAVRVLLGYNALAAAGLSFVRASGRHRGIALMPAIVLHAALAGLFAGRARRARP